MRVSAPCLPCRSRCAQAPRRLRRVDPPRQQRVRRSETHLPSWSLVPSGVLLSPPRSPVSQGAPLTRFHACAAGYQPAEDARRAAAEAAAIRPPRSTRACQKRQHVRYATPERKGRPRPAHPGIGRPATYRNRGCNATPARAQLRHTQETRVKPRSRAPEQDVGAPESQQWRAGMYGAKAKADARTPTPLGFAHLVTPHKEVRFGGPA